MALEPVTNLDDLVVTNPTDTDPVSEGDNHIRNLKVALAANVTGDAVNTRLLSGGALKFQVKADGAEVTGDLDLLVATLLQIITSVDATQTIRMLNADTPDLGVAIQQEILTGKVTIGETDGAGVAGNSWAIFDRALGVSLFFDNLLRLSTLINGARSTGAVFDVDNSLVDEQTELLIRNLIGAWKFGNNGVTGRLQIDQADAAGVFEKILMTAVRDGEIVMRYNGAIALETAEGNVNNSRGVVKDGNGADQPIGFNSLPAVTISGNLTLLDIHNGVKLRSDNNQHTITLPSTLLNGFGCLYINGSTSAVSLPDTLSIPGVGRHYTGTGIVQRTAGTFSLAPGCTATFTHIGAGTWEIWGNGIS